MISLFLLKYNWYEIVEIYKNSQNMKKIFQNSVNLDYVYLSIEIYD